MRNQPKYNFFKNTSYALEGLFDIFKNERSFQIEIVLFLLLLPILFYFDFTTLERIILFLVLSFVLIAETINSSIERVVDLASPNYHDLAKKAKDAGSAIVFLSIAVCLITWGVVLYDQLF